MLFLCISTTEEQKASEPKCVYGTEWKRSLPAVGSQGDPAAAVGEDMEA